MNIFRFFPIKKILNALYVLYGSLLKFKRNLVGRNLFLTHEEKLPQIKPAGEFFNHCHHNGLSGIKSFGEHLNNFASSFKCCVLYFARKLGLSIWPINPFETSRCRATSSCSIPRPILFSFTWLTMNQSILLLRFFLAIPCKKWKDCKDHPYTCIRIFTNLL